MKRNTYPHLSPDHLIIIGRKQVYLSGYPQPFKDDGQENWSKVYTMNEYNTRAALAIRCVKIQ